MTWSSWVGEQDRPDPTRPDEVEDRAGVVRRVDDDALVVVADHPHVVLDLPRPAVEAERPRGDRVLDAHPAGRAAETGRGPLGSVTAPVPASVTADHRAQHGAVVHLGERRLDVTEPDRLGDEGVEVEAPLPVEVDEHREVARGQAVAVPAGLQRPAATEDLDHRQGHLLVGRRDADEDDAAGEVARVERLLVGLRPADRLDDDVRAEPAGQLADPLDDVLAARVDGVRRAEAVAHSSLGGRGRPR